MERRRGKRRSPRSARTARNPDTMPGMGRGGSSEPLEPHSSHAYQNVRPGGARTEDAPSCYLLPPVPFFWIFSVVIHVLRGP